MKIVKIKIKKKLNEVFPPEPCVVATILWSICRLDLSEVSGDATETDQF
jgi:hypothetical protein